MSRHIALIPAAGVGARFGAGKPKQYVEINGQTVLQHTLAVFLAHAQIDHIAVVLSPEDNFFQTASNHKLSVLKCGGETRAETVRNGLAALLQQGLAAPHDNILVHDAARCCLPPEALSRLIQEAGGQAEGGILAVPVADTLKRADAAQHIGATVARAGLWQAQTPQMFRYGQLQKALKNCTQVTDEAGAIEALGLQPKLVRADATNLKVTYPADLALAAMILRGRK